MFQPSTVVKSSGDNVEILLKWENKLTRKLHVGTISTYTSDLTLLD